LSADERDALARLSWSRRASAAQVARATALLAVADGQSCLAAARRAGRRDGDTVAAWVARFNREGLAAVRPAHGGGPPIRYADEQQRRLLADAMRVPDRARDGTATWSLSTLQRALRQAKDGLPTISTSTIWRTLREAGLSWQKSRTWCTTGAVARPRRHGRHGHRRRCRREKKLIERAYTLGMQAGLAVWCEDEAGPFQAIPHPGSSWRPLEQPVTQPHE
jgi:transposase